eukprot:12899139-Prorocentrum_lima.AAC.1
MVFPQWQRSSATKLDLVVAGRLLPPIPVLAASCSKQILNWICGFLTVGPGPQALSLEPQW